MLPQVFRVVAHDMPRDQAEATDKVIRLGGSEINEHEILVRGCI